MFSCVCDSTFTLKRLFTRHKKNCPVVARQGQRTYHYVRAQEEERAAKRARGDEDGGLLPWNLPMTQNIPSSTATGSQSERPASEPEHFEATFGRLESNWEAFTASVDDGPPLLQTTRGRNVRPTWKLRDALPEGDGPLNLDSATRETEPSETPSSQGAVRRVVLLVTERIYSATNHFGLRRFYKRRPHKVPAPGINLEAHYVPKAAAPAPKLRRTLHAIIHPFPNLSAWLFAHHHHSSRTKSKADRRSLQSLLTRNSHVDHDLLDERDGWRSSSVTIGVPSGHKPTQASRRDHAALTRRLQRSEQLPGGPPSHAVDGPYRATPQQRTSCTTPTMSNTNAPV
ncbi:hypothetical protein C8Q77DRAFT_756026 [Trametes polyzona]|nr:hypothetical protein C8Q77DRAFT_756026 [Trametes polyzona]